MRNFYAADMQLLMSQLSFNLQNYNQNNSNK